MKRQEEGSPPSPAPHKRQNSGLESMPGIDPLPEAQVRSKNLCAVVAAFPVVSPCGSSASRLHLHAMISFFPAQEVSSLSADHHSRYDRAQTSARIWLHATETLFLLAESGATVGFRSRCLLPANM